MWAAWESRSSLRQQWPLLPTPPPLCACPGLGHRPTGNPRPLAQGGVQPAAESSEAQRGRGPAGAPDGEESCVGICTFVRLTLRPVIVTPTLCTLNSLPRPETGASGEQCGAVR